MHVPSPSKLSPAQTRTVVLLLAPVTLLTMALYLTARHVDSTLIRDWLDITHWTVAYITAAVLSWLAVRWSDAEHKPEQRWFAYGLTATALGQIAWDVQYALGMEGFPLPSDFVSMLLGPCCIRALLLTVRQHRPSALNWALLLDTTMLTVATLALALSLLLPWQSEPFSWYLLFLTLLLGSLLASTCLGLIIWPTLRLRPTRSWLVMFCAAAINGYLWLQWIYLAQSHRVDANPWLFLAFSLVTLALGVGAVLWRVEIANNPRWAQRSDNLLRMMPLLMIVIAAISIGLVWSIPGAPPAVNNTIYASAALVLALAILRQSLLLADRDRMLASEQRAGELERTFRALFQLPYGGLALLSSDGRFLRFNPGCGAMLGYAPDVLTHLHSDAIFLTPDDQKLSGPLGLVDETGAGTLEALCQRGDGQQIHLEINSVLVPDSGGQLFSVFRDITDRKRSQETRLHLEAQLRQSQKLEAIGAFASGIAHDFNNMLSAIMGNIELAMQDIDPRHPAQLYLSEIRKSSQRARELIRRIVGYGKPHSTHMRPQSLGAVVADSLTLVRAALPATVEIHSALDLHLPQANIDSAQIDQVLLNLCTNAWQAMPENKGRIDITLGQFDFKSESSLPSQDLMPGKYACLCISDNGHGMDATLLHQIFEPFFTTKPPGTGSGLGLSIVHNIIRAHGGAITVQSSPGAGACFCIYLPLLADTTAVTAPAPSASLVVTRGSGQHIVYIDDEEALVLLTVKMLQRLGYHVTGYTDARQALRDLMSGQIQADVVITDQAMPGMSGSELAWNLLRQQPNARMILVSGYLPAEDIQRALELGFQAVILKPDTIDQLAQTIDELLRKHPSTTAIPT